MTLFKKCQTFFHQTSMRFHSTMATLEPQKYVIARTCDGKYPAGQRASCSDITSLSLTSELIHSNFIFLKEHVETWKNVTRQV